MLMANAFYGINLLFFNYWFSCLLLIDDGRGENNNLHLIMVHFVLMLYEYMIFEFIINNMKVHTKI